MSHNKNKKGVLYLATFDPTVSASGTATRGRLFLRFFSEHYDTHLVHMKEKDNEGKDESVIKSLHTINTITYSNFDYFVFCRKLYRAAEEVLRRNQISFIFADFEKAGCYAYLLSKRFGIPYIYNSHNVEYLRYIDFAKRDPVRYVFVPYMYILERVACKNALYTIAISERDARSFRKWVTRDRLLSMPCAFDEALFNPFYEEKQNDVPIVLMVGNYRNPGNREGAYLMREKILPKVVEKHPRVIFRCIGKNFPGDIQHPNIQSIGFVDDLFSEYQEANIIIVPITIGGGVKIKAIEGLACGKFVISTQKGMEGITTESLNNLSVLPIEKFSDCILSLLARPVPKDTSNWERISDEFGIRKNLLDLKNKIDNLV